MTDWLKRYLVIALRWLAKIIAKPERITENDPTKILIEMVINQAELYLASLTVRQALTELEKFRAYFPLSNAAGYVSLSWYDNTRYYNWRVKLTIADGEIFLGDNDKRLIWERFSLLAKIYSARLERIKEHDAQLSALDIIAKMMGVKS